eukprot:GEMP01041839.1.p1 GENE.GEMP01041839.1~~GEMP01041839.1.p1  ORF type:complete len:410 (+),score=93.22 GEMP01041839.1:201-1430(+)
MVALRQCTKRSPRWATKVTTRARKKSQAALKAGTDKTTPAKPSTDKLCLPDVACLNSSGIARNGVIRLGVCTMDRKAQSQPMKELLAQVCVSDLFQVIIFGDTNLLDRPVEDWPICDVLIVFHTHQFPLHKAREYCALRKPVLINDVNWQEAILDRRVVYDTLRDHGVAVPEHIVADYSSPDVSIVEDDAYVEINGQRLEKPFVEKPVDAENHEISIYHRDGSVTQLFRKQLVDGIQRNSRHVEHGKIRRQGCFIYQKFVVTEGVDIKAYSVGPDYAHCESRKAPVVDGVVEVGSQGEEVRRKVDPTPEERKLIAKTVKAFRQNVCGIDILRTPTRSYVIDVNGWSFVKRNPQYTSEAATILRQWCIQAMMARRPTFRPLRLKINPEATHELVVSSHAPDPISSRKPKK